MEVSIFVARVMAGLYLAVAVGYFLNREYYRQALPKIMDSSGFMFLGGFFAFLVGALLVQYHNTWEYNWTTLITLIGWIAMIKGLAFFAVPDLMMQFKKLLSPNSLYLYMWLCFVLGLLFTYLGFFVA